jgi:hypothetical protein
MQSQLLLSAQQHPATLQTVCISSAALDQQKCLQEEVGRPDRAGRHRRREPERGVCWSNRPRRRLYHPGWGRWSRATVPRGFQGGADGMRPSASGVPPTTPSSRRVPVCETGHQLCCWTTPSPCDAPVAGVRAGRLVAQRTGAVPALHGRQVKADPVEICESDIMDAIGRGYDAANWICRQARSGGANGNASAAAGMPAKPKLWMSGILVAGWAGHGASQKRHFCLPVAHLMK